VWRPLQGQPGFLRVVTDVGIVVTDEHGAWMKGLDRSGTERWSRPDIRLVDPVAVDVGVLGVVGSEATGFAASVIDSRGAIRDLTIRSASSGAAWPHLWTNASSSTVAVVGDIDFWTALGDPAGARAQLIRVSNGSILGGDVVVIPGE